MIEEKVKEGNKGKTSYTLGLVWAWEESACGGGGGGREARVVVRCQIPKGNRQ